MLKCGVNQYECIVRGSKDSYYVFLSFPNYPSFEDMSIKTSYNLKLLMDKHDINIQSHIANCTTIEDCFLCIKSIVAKETGKSYSYYFYQAVLTEIGKIGPECQLRNDFSEVEFCCNDSGGRTHNALISLPSRYPDERITIAEHQLPFSQEFPDEMKSAHTLLQFHKAFRSLIESCQSFWDAMDVLDSSCHIIEPRTPLLSDCYRRILVTDNCSALLTFNPLDPQRRPEVEFRGPDEEVQTLRNAFARNLLDDKWDSQVDIHLNLLNLLDLSCFPTKELEVEEETALLKPGECGICFEDRLDGQAANLRCDNERCASQYHQFCLLKYLTADLSNVRIKNAVLGKCPTCRESIGCATVTWTNY